MLTISRFDSSQVRTLLRIGIERHLVFPDRKGGLPQVRRFTKTGSQKYAFRLINRDLGRLRIFPKRIGFEGLNGCPR